MYPWGFLSCDSVLRSCKMSANGQTGWGMPSNFPVLSHYSFQQLSCNLTLFLPTTFLYSHTILKLKVYFLKGEKNTHLQSTKHLWINLTKNEPKWHAENWKNTAQSSQMEKCLIHWLKVLLLLWCHFFPKHLNWFNSFPGGTVVENPPASAGDAGDAGLIPGLRRSPGVENGNLLQHPCLESSMDRGAWQTIVHGVTKSQTWPSIHTIPI